MYDLTILCLMKDSMEYIPRFLAQVNSAFEHFERCHLIVCEGDSKDGTKEYLANLAQPDNKDVKGDVTVVELNINGPSWGSVSSPTRWWALEQCWNANLKQLEPTKYAVCIESDLIWEWPTMKALIGWLDTNQGDVFLPLLMRSTPITGKYFFDTNAFRLHGQNFQNYKPYHPEFDETKRFMQLDTGGGMLVTHGDLLSKAIWKSQCVLHWPEGTHVICDTQLEILHP